jgi:hypothetical protein
MFSPAIPGSFPGVGPILPPDTHPRAAERQPRGALTNAIEFLYHEWRYEAAGQEGSHDYDE